MSRACAEPVLFVAMDSDNVHCMTESLLDVWFAGLTPAQKADVYAQWDAVQNGGGFDLESAIANLHGSFRAILHAPFHQPQLLASEASVLSRDHYTD